MKKPSFDLILHHARVRAPQQIGPQEIPPGTRIYKCECCNDTGVVQSWKLNRWASRITDEPLDAIMSLPVLCSQYETCGETQIQVFADKDKDENASRTATRSLLKGESVGALISAGKMKALSLDQSRYIHHKVLEYRELLSNTEKGRQFVADVKAAAKAATPVQPHSNRLTHIGSIIATFDFPIEPDFNDDSAAVQAAPDPRDFQAPADTRSAVPGGDAPVHLEGSDDSDLDHICPEF